MDADVRTTAEDRAVEEVRAASRAWFEAHWEPDVELGTWWERLAGSGWGLPTWPEGWFGRGLPGHLASVVGEERQRVGATGPPSGIGVMMAGPTILEHGTDEQRRRWLPAMVTGREVWCQLFSEPGAGSDLAGVQTRARRDGDRWIVDGQKVWTSGAQYARWGILIARTDPDAPKHAGITYVVIDMEQPGVEVRPLREMSGGATFNEVFLTGAVVPHDDVIGEVNRGWSVAVTTLAHERRSLGATGMAGATGGGAIIGRPDLSIPAAGAGGGGAGGDMAALATAFGGGGGRMVAMLPRLLGDGDDPVVRQEVAEIYSLLEISRYTGLRAKAAAERGERAGPEVSIGKLVMSRLAQRLRDVGLRLEGAGGMLTGVDAPLGGMLQQLALLSPAVSIAGGTDEIQRNIIGERVLGLQPEPRGDKDVPFRDLAVGTQRRQS